jgi:hypothetical protein
MNSIESHRAIADQPLTVEGITKPLHEWARLRGIPYKTVAMRWARGHRNPKTLLHKKAANG